MHKILVVDDDKLTHSFIIEALRTRFEFVSVFNAEEALDVIEKIKPSVILLAVEMPKMNGYEACELIKANPQTVSIPIIFLSKRDQLRDRMPGFEAGADECMVKPFHAEDLLAKLNIIIQYQEERQKLTIQINEAQKTAFLAISSSSDLGLAIRFIEEAHQVSSFHQLSIAFFRVTQSMSLNCTLMVNVQDQRVFFSSSYNSVSPMESELITRLSSDKRFIDFGCRTQINYPTISLLIKNMPLDDMERYGRLKDFFPAMLSFADTKITQICSQIALKNQLEELQNAYESISEKLLKVKSALEANQNASIKIMRDMMMELDANISRMALDEEQERYIVNRVDNAIDQVHKAASSNKSINQSFEWVLENLKSVLTSQKQIHDFLEQSEVFGEKEGSSAVGYEMDIELF
jgi:DNA-binding response OmpR family regulator